MKRVLFILLLVVSGCSKNGPENSCVQCDGENLIAVTATIPATRGIPTASVSQIQSLGLFCSYTGEEKWDDTDVPAKLHNRKMTYNTVTGFWEYADGDPAQWDALSAADNYTFFAYAPFATGDYDSVDNSTGNGLTVISTAVDADYPRLRYNIPERVESQPDLMVAVPVYNRHMTAHPVALQMKHALTCVGFHVSGTGERITGIAVSGVASVGELEIEGEHILWNDMEETPLPGGHSAKVDFDDGQNYFTAGNERNLLAGDGWLMMIPQIPGENSAVHLFFDDNTHREFSLNTFEWRAGEQVIYHIDLSGSSGEGTVTVLPNTLSLSRLTQFPVTQTLALNCTSLSGDVAYDVPWTLTSDSPWLSLSTVDYPGSATNTISGTGPYTVYLFVQMNPGTAARQATVHFGDPAENRVACTVEQVGTE